MYNTINNGVINGRKTGMSEYDLFKYLKGSFSQVK